jgi:tetratricopeptide (TPR) repeat protein
VFVPSRQQVLLATLAIHCAFLNNATLAEQQPGLAPGDLVGGGELMESAGDLGSPSLDFQDAEQPVLVSPDATSYQFYITDMESRFGPYAPGLSEQLLGLGKVYQNQGLHQQAIDIFKRAVHLSRINGGLNSPEQIPPLQQQIRSLVAVGDFDSADERQYYLFRVQSSVYGRQSPQMSSAMLERAEWERQAYYLSVGETSFLRLLTMWELYSSVLRNVARQEGKLSVSLLSPLQGLLQTQYLISSYGPDSQMGMQTNGSLDDNYGEQARFSMVRVSNYKQGQAVITAMREVYGYNENEESPLPAEALVKLGDWHLWHQKRESAMEIYLQAWDELGALEEGEQLQKHYFGEPILLPDMPGSNKDLTEPDVLVGYAEVTYDISPRGRVRNLELQSTEPAAPSGTTSEETFNPVQLLRRVKRLQFRPRIENREAVLIENVRRRYAF